MDAVAWLQGLRLPIPPNRLERYIEGFERAALNEEGILSLDHANLKELGVELLNDRLLLLKAADDLRTRKAAETGEGESIWRRASHTLDGPEAAAAAPRPSIGTLEGRARWLDPRPSTKASEALHLVIAAGWVGMLAAPFSNPAAAKDLIRGERELAAVGALAAAPALFLPLLFPSTADRKLPLRERHAIKAFVFLLSHAAFSLYFYWHYFSQAFAPHMALPWLKTRVNGVPVTAVGPLFVFLGAVLTPSSLILRRWRTSWLGRKLPVPLRAAGSLLLALLLSAAAVAAALYALAAASGACGGKVTCCDHFERLWAARRAFAYQTVPGLALAAACLAIAVLTYASFNARPPASASGALLAAAGASMVGVCLLDGARLAGAELAARRPARWGAALKWVPACVPFL